MAVTTGVPEAYIYDAVRTPRGRGKASGSLHEVKPISLVVGLIHELRRRFPALDPAAIDDVVLGVVTPVGDQGGDIARAAALAGMGLNLLLFLTASWHTRPYFLGSDIVFVFAWLPLVLAGTRGQPALEHAVERRPERASRWTRRSHS